MNFRRFLRRLAPKCIANAAVFLFVLLFFSPANLLATRWTGQGQTASWNDGENWESNSVPVPGLSAIFVFDAPAGNTFGFGGKEPFSAASLTFTENAGPFSFSAPSIVLGGSAGDDKTNGYILEDIFCAGSVINRSPNAQVLGSDVTLGWDTVFNASNANLVVSGSLTGASQKLTKEGPADLIISNGKIQLNSLDLKEGRVALVGSEATLQNLLGKNRQSALMVLNGSSLKTDAATPEKTLSLYARISLAGVDKTSGIPSRWDLSGDNLNVYGDPFSLAHGASITNAGAISLMMPLRETNTIDFALSGGSSVFCQGLTIGNTEKYSYKAASNLTFTITGTPLSEKRQTTLSAGGKRINVGFRADSSTRAHNNSLIVTDNARVVDVEQLTVSAGNGDNFNSAQFMEGAFLSCTGMSIGYWGNSNRVKFSGATTRASVGGGDIRIGHTQNWGEAHDNSLSISDGARVSNAGTIIIGQLKSSKGESDSGNFVRVQSGAWLESKGAVVSYAGTRNGLSTNNFMLVEGLDTVWNASASRIGIGYAAAGDSMGNTIYIKDGAIVTNASVVNVGVGSGRTSKGNRLILANGAKLFSTDAVQVGANDNRNKASESEDNSILVAGGKLGWTLWDFGGAGLYIGSATAWNANCKNNKFILGPGAQVKNVGALVIGRGDGNFKENALVLAGGMISAKSLTVREKNGIEVSLTPAGIKPILIETDVTFDYDTYILPTASPGMKSGKIPLLGWKGKAKHLDKLKLAKGVDKKKWTLEIQESNKRIFLDFKEN